MRKIESPPISEARFNRSEAAHKYLEQYGDPIVTNTYLKLTILILAAVSLSTLTLFYRAQAALSSIKPLVIRINDVGRAEAVDYQNFAYKPQEAENRYFVSEWARAYYDRQRARGHRHQAALRALAAKWVKIIFVLWSRHIAYDENYHLAMMTRQHLRQAA